MKNLVLLFIKDCINKYAIFNNYLLESGTNLKAINMRLPAPAIAAAINPKSVGIVLEAKKRVAKMISMIKKLILNKISLTKPYYTKKKDT